jgi:hypothetical protein
VFAISGVSGEGIQVVLRALGDQVAKNRKRMAPKRATEDVWTP